MKDQDLVDNLKEFENSLNERIIDIKEIREENIKKYSGRGNQEWLFRDMGGFGEALIAYEWTLFQLKADFPELTTRKTLPELMWRIQKYSLFLNQECQKYSDSQDNWREREYGKFVRAISSLFSRLFPELNDEKLKNES